jgi:hypothetical protein
MWNAIGKESDERGMDMLTRGVVTPLGAEQANVIQAPIVASDVQGMSFAKSFGEVAAGAGGFVGATPGASIAKDGDAPAGSMNKLLNVSVGDGLKETSALTNTALVKSGDVGITKSQSIPAQDSEKIEDVPQAGSLVDGNPDETEVSGGAAPLTVEKPIGPIGETAGTKIDSVPLQVMASKVAQAVLVGAEDQSVTRKSATVAAAVEKSGAEKTTKKELKDKGHFAATTADAKNISIPVEGLGAQVTMTVPTEAATSTDGKAQTIDTASQADSIVGAASGGVAGATVSKGRPNGADRGVAGQSASGVSKDGTVAAANSDDGVAGVKKDDADSSKTVAGMVSANTLIEGTTHGSGGAVATMATHGVLAVTGDVAVAAKPSANANSVATATAAGRDGVDPGTAGVGDGHRTLEATPTTLEVGVSNGTHGWLKIRAEMADGGVVNASLSATTSAGQEMLHRELPSLTAYLQEERIGMGSVVLQTTAAAGSREFAGGMENDEGREQMQRGSQEGESKHDTSGTTFSDSGEAYVQGGLSGIAEITTNTVYAGGSWLSVRA